jgi:hypothetical protein
MTTYEVTHATNDGSDYDSRIDMIGGPDYGGWKMRQEDAIYAIKTGRTSFYVQNRNSLGNVFAQQNALTGLMSLGNRIPIEIRPGSLAYREHLATVADGIETNNLRSLPDCPLEYRRVNELP